MSCDETSGEIPCPCEKTRRDGESGVERYGGTAREGDSQGQPERIHPPEIRSDGERISEKLDSVLLL